MPAERILADADARRTADSIRRLNCWAGDNRVIVISQEAQVARALFLASAAGRSDLGFAASDPPDGRAAQDAVFEAEKRLAALRRV